MLEYVIFIFTDIEMFYQKFLENTALYEQSAFEYTYNGCTVSQVALTYDLTREREESRNRKEQCPSYSVS
jgi:hypothetical protein